MKYYRLCPTEGLLKIIHQIILFLAVLIFGCTVQNRKLHIVCSIVNDDTLTIITAYEPDLNKWNETFTKRRDT